MERSGRFNHSAQREQALKPSDSPALALRGYEGYEAYEVGAQIPASGQHALFFAERTADRLPVVIKTLGTEYPDKQRVAELRREYQTLLRLADVDDVVRGLALEEYGNGNVALVMARFGLSLADHLDTLEERRLSISRFFRIVEKIIGAVDGVHRRGMIHKDLSPSNILIEPDSDGLLLIDFELASELSREHQGASLSGRLEGTLAYLSPEQTGRMNRDIDYRSDYYSLGVTCFELLTGRLPFQAHDALEWVHCHIGKAPPAPYEFVPTLPAMLSVFVLKLMAKNPDERYQSAYGMMADLTECRKRWEQTGQIDPFPLGEHDVSAVFQIPQQLYGRDGELARLMDLFAEVAGGAVDLCMVSGHSGIGKTALVNEIAVPLARERGYLIQGKFDQFQRNSAYSAVIAAFRALVMQILSEPAERLARWRDDLLQALGSNGAVIIDVIPELELIVGPQPAVPQLPPTEAQNRFQILFVSFVRVFANEQHPLVVFLDDLQWSDGPTLALIHRLVTAHELSHLLLVGAYRSNEVGAEHLLQLALNDIRKLRPVHELQVPPLDLPAVTQLVAATLHTDDARAAPLAALLQQTAQGNPFFINELLKHFHREGSIRFAAKDGQWAWDMDQVRRAGVSNDAVAFVLEGLRKLPDETQQVLQLAACIGNSFDLRTLSAIHERTMDATGDALLAALKRNLVIPLDDDYRLFGGEGGVGLDAEQERSLNPRYRFAHDRVQEAAYELIDETKKQSLHLSVGRLIRRHLGADELDEHLFDIVGHLNRGRRLIDDAGERHELARLNLQAGTKARLSSAYASALVYLETGRELLGEQAWRDDVATAMALEGEYQQCLYLTGRHDDADRCAHGLLERATTALEKVEILSTLTRQYATIGKMEASIEAAIRGLALLGIEFSARPGKGAIAREVQEVEANLAGRRIADLIEAPPLSNRREVLAIRLLMEIFPAAFLSGSGNLFPYLVLKSVNLSLRYGNSPESAFAYAAFGMLLCGALNDPAKGHEYGKLAVEMNERFEDIALKSRVIYVYAMFIHHWSEHWSSMTPWFRRGIEAGYQSGDLLYLAYSAQDCIIWDPKLDLETAEREHANYLAIVKECEYRDSFDSGSLFLQMQRNFLGKTKDLCSLSDDEFDEAQCVEGMLQRRFMTGVANYHIYKTEICALYGRYDEALEHVRIQDGLIASAMSLPQLVRYAIVAFLTLAACYPRFDAKEQAAVRKRLIRDLRQMKAWADHCPLNFRHLELLMWAELDRLDGRSERAINHYEAAIDSAHASEFRRDEAVANELAARHLLALGRRKAAEGYLRSAHYLFDRWGARRKVALLEEQFPQIREWGAGRPLANDGEATTRRSSDISSEALDLQSVLKASRAISGEIQLDRLLQTTIQIMLENAGGQRGCIVTRKDDGFVVEAQGEADDPQATPFSGADGILLPETVLNQVFRTRQSLVVNDVAKAGKSFSDAYIATHRPQSLLCIPLHTQGRIESAVYIENRLAAGVFTEARIEMVNLLTAQAKVSIENARLFDDLRRLTTAQQRFVPREFLESLNHRDIAEVRSGETVAKTMSVLFADLRGFTPLAERLPPRQVIDILNAYFVAVEPAITAGHGFIGSYTGDEIMGLFDLGADNAVRAGIGIFRGIEELNRNSRALGWPELRAGAGINTGQLLMGTVGTAERIQCAALGDTTNLASRTEQLTKYYGARLLITDNTWRRLEHAGRYGLRRVDRVAVKGKELPVELFEVIDAESEERRDAKLATLDLLNEAFSAYLDRRFDEALSVLRHAMTLDAEDPVLSILAERCERYRLAPPDDWQGYEKLSHK